MPGQWTQAGLLKVLGRGWGNETYMEMTYVPPNVWLSVTFNPPANYWASLIYYTWVDSLANAGEAFMQHPQVIFHYIRYTADHSMFAGPHFQVSTQEYPAIFMYRNITWFPMCAITHTASIDFLTREDLNEALKWLEGWSLHNTLDEWRNR